MWFKGDKVLQVDWHGSRHGWIPVLLAHRLLRLCKSLALQHSQKRFAMAVTHGEGLLGPPPLVALAVLALLGGLVYLCTLCAACRRHGRRKKVPPDGVKLVDESRLRQTQLRSLSKSDTRLHELYSLKAKNSNQRPASLDFPLSSLPPDSLHSSVLLHRQLPQIPSSEPTAPDQTYSNLLFAPPHRAPPDTLYECLAMGEDNAPTATGTPASPPPRVGQGAADYACIRKVKKMVPEEQEGAVAEPSAAPQCWEGAGDVPRLKLEDMYSTVCKATKKRNHGPAASPRDGGSGRSPPPHEEPPPAACWPTAPSEPCYEAINDRAWAARGPEPDYEAVDVHWKKAAKRDRPGKPSLQDNLYESVGDMWGGESRGGAGWTTANGLQVYITNL